MVKTDKPVKDMFYGAYVYLLDNPQAPVKKYGYESHEELMEALIEIRTSGLLIITNVGFDWIPPHRIHRIRTFRLNIIKEKILEEIDAFGNEWYGYYTDEHDKKLKCWDDFEFKDNQS